jgi:peptidyl-prolyl cis-trans isomerase A (cyclophilin A)
MKTLQSHILFFLVSLGALVSACHAGEEPAVANAANPVVVFETTLGSFTLELYPEKSPITVENFLGYVDSGFYHNTLFHRVIPGFMAQGGGMTSGLEPKPGNAPITNESHNGVKNLRGTISMARTGDPHSATSQFFINVEDNATLDARPGVFGYAVFGKVVDGMDIVDKIVKVPTTNLGPYRNVPREDVVILSTKRLETAE